MTGQTQIGRLRRLEKAGVPLRTLPENGWVMELKRDGLVTLDKQGWCALTAKGRSWLRRYG